MSTKPRNLKVSGLERPRLFHQPRLAFAALSKNEAHEEAEDRQKDPAMVRRERKNAGGGRKIENCSDEHRPPTYAISQRPPNGRTQDGPSAPVPAGSQSQVRT
jgi:hypothetical protein